MLALDMQIPTSHAEVEPSKGYPGPDFSIHNLRRTRFQIDDECLMPGTLTPLGNVYRDSNVPVYMKPRIVIRGFVVDGVDLSEPDQPALGDVCTDAVYRQALQQSDATPHIPRTSLPHPPCVSLDVLWARHLKHCPSDAEISRGPDDSQFTHHSGWKNGFRGIQEGMELIFREACWEIETLLRFIFTNLSSLRTTNLEKQSRMMECTRCLRKMPPDSKRASLSDTMLKTYLLIEPEKLHTALAQTAAIIKDASHPINKARTHRYVHRQSAFLVAALLIALGECIDHTEEHAKFAAEALKDFACLNPKYEIYSELFDWDFIQPVMDDMYAYRTSLLKFPYP